MRFIAMALAVGLSGCVTTKDLARTLRYADNKPVGVENIRFVDLQKMKRGKTCTLNLLYALPVYGDGSLITAAENGKINTVQLIGETGKWYFPFNTNCTVVYGDKPETAPPAAPRLEAGS
jgi:hypothetical protein